MGERAFISNYQSLGYYKNDFLTVLKPKRQVESFYRSKNAGGHARAGQ